MRLSPPGSTRAGTWTLCEKPPTGTALFQHVGHAQHPSADSVGRLALSCRALASVGKDHLHFRPASEQNDHKVLVRHAALHMPPQQLTFCHAHHVQRFLLNSESDCTGHVRRAC